MCIDPKTQERLMVVKIYGVKKVYHSSMLYLEQSAFKEKARSANVYKESSGIRMLTSFLTPWGRFEISNH